MNVDIELCRILDSSGLANGRWEAELCPDFFMGCRAGLGKMSTIDKLSLGVILTDGSQSHPDGTLRALFIRHGRYVVADMLRNGVPLTIQNLSNEFMDYRQENLDEIQKMQRWYF